MESRGLHDAGQQLSNRAPQKPGLILQVFCKIIKFSLINTDQFLSLINIEFSVRCSLENFFLNNGYGRQGVILEFLNKGLI